jgi:hypothetical protein
MDIVLLLHSAVRFLILLAAVVGIIKTAISLVSKRETDPTDRMIASAFRGLYDLQVLLGLLIIFLGGLSNALHPVVMFIGVVTAHALQAVSRRAQGTNVHLLRLAFYVVPLAIILVGLAIINHLPV